MNNVKEMKPKKQNHVTQFLFLHIPKTGGCSISRAFKGVVNLSHVPLSTVPHYHNAFLFTFVRNPFDRLVSAFFYLRAGGINSSDRRDKRKYIKKLKWPEFIDAFFQDRTSYFNQQHLKHQSYYLDQERCNFIGRFENFESDLKKISDLVGIDTPKIGRANTSRHLPFHIYYDEAIARKVVDLYKSDFELFGYSKESWRGCN